MFDGAPEPSPANIEIEQALLAALFFDRRAWEACVDVLRPEHFAWAIHGRIYEACGHLIDQGRKPSPVSLRDFFQDDPALVEAGGPAYLAKLATALITVSNVPSYAAQIVDLAKRRQIIAAIGAGRQRAHEVELDPAADTVLREIEEALYSIGEDQAKRSGPVGIGQAADEAIAMAERAYQNRGKILGAPTGLTDLDKLIGGLQPGHLVIVAGRPSMGKTALVGGLGAAAAKHFRQENPEQPKIVLEFELEMSRQEMARRRLAAITGLKLQALKNGWLSAGDFSRLTDARAQLAALPLETDDTERLSLNDIRSRSRRAARRRGLGLVVVDHIGLISVPSEVRRNGETAAISEITVSLKALSKELGVPVIALSQLNRDLERRDDKRPMLADLRQSGSIEQDADLVVFVYREEYYLSRGEPVRALNEKPEAFAQRVTVWNDALERAAGRADIIVAKHRDGPIGTVKCRFDAERVQFQNLDQEEMPL